MPPARDGSRPDCRLPRCRATARFGLRNSRSWWPGQCRPEARARSPDRHRHDTSVHPCARRSAVDAGAVHAARERSLSRGGPSRRCTSGRVQTTAPSCGGRPVGTEGDKRQHDPCDSRGRPRALIGRVISGGQGDLGPNAARSTGGEALEDGAQEAGLRCGDDALADVVLLSTSPGTRLSGDGPWVRGLVGARRRR